MIHMKKGDTVIRVGPKQRAAFAKQGFEPYDPPVEDAVAEIKNPSDGSPVLKPGQVVLTKGQDLCIADPRQVAQLKSAGWTDGEPSAAESEPEAPETETEPVEDEEAEGEGEDDANDEEANDGSVELDGDEVGEEQRGDA